jgi:anthranilate/para-aminobenzoate synthase component II
LPYDELSDHDISQYSAYVISPGPGHPSDYQYDTILQAAKPTLGVCLGMQIINTFYGGAVSRLADCVHGVTEQIDYRGELLDVAIYNSLYCSEVSDELDVFATREDTPMGIKHKELDIVGLQFHTESFMTKDGDEILKDVCKSINII